MNCREAVLSFVSYPGLPAFLLFLVFVSQAILKGDLMDGVVRYVPVIFVLNYFFQASYSRILLFVDFENNVLILSLIHI